MSPPPHAAALGLAPPPAAARPVERRGWRALLVRRALALLGPGTLVAVGYLDPGNWATDLAGGSRWGYALLWVVALSGAMAMLLQVLAARLGIASGLDLAQACRAESSRASALVQWLACEIALCAADLAEVIGTAVALNLLFGLPLLGGVALTVADVLLVLALQQRGVRRLEAFVAVLIATVVVCLGYAVASARPEWRAVLGGFVPTARTVVDPDMLYIAIGIVGATVMPHNLYLHSSVAQRLRGECGGVERAVRRATVDIVGALTIAFVVNAAILVLAAAAFHARGQHDVAELADAHALLGAMTGAGFAGTAFAIALLASGQSASLTATLTGQIVMEGFLRLTIAAWARRLLTRGIAVVPALVVIAGWGESAVGSLLVATQVVLSLQLPFAIVPLVRYTSNRRMMGAQASGRITTMAAVAIAALIIALNAVLVLRAVSG